MREMTLRQVEVIRAVMMAGTIQGAAKLLNVSAPGISRLVKYTESSLGIRLFERKGGLFVPSSEAEAIFEMIHQVYRQMENLNGAVGALRKGEDVRLSFASAPSIAQFIAARAIRGVRQRFPDLFIDLNILKIEETTDYLLLDRGEFVIMSSAVDNPALSCEPLARGRLVAIVPDGHRLAGKRTISVHDLAAEDFVGVHPDDPYGAALAQPFRDAGVTPRYTMRGRFAQTVVSLVRHGLGVAVIDEFSVAEVYLPGVTRRPLTESAGVTAWVLTRKGRQLSSFAEFAIDRFRRELAQAVARDDWNNAPNS
ncbi:LysR family transcriptional regulator [Paracoccus sediminis]|uniref:DNA-binding transcriptional regulator, LysR family n=1 Tax=Paracoccus sediminis TaxID=1214787 RepID=A0A238WCU7_9RHOB|nr:LysR family transcriptional regulator [Paracoccus sediminis]TBN50923.1 LysR family transcriptional regulator [Paracoccus sediminis]SNR44406.1 DNA-binding transcriptional regulator, LysR family [Paracoccus sediminis]